MSMLRSVKLLPLLCLLFAGCSAHQVAVNPPGNPPNADHTIKLDWTQSFANNKACSATITTSCINGFQEGYMVGSTPTQMHADTTTTICSGSSDPLSCTTTFNGLLPLGQVNFYVITTGVDQNGAATFSTSTQTATPSNVTLDSAQNVKATVQ